MGCGGSKQQTNVVPFQEPNQDNVSNNLQTTSKQKASVTSIQKKERDDDKCSKRSLQSQGQVAETLTQTLKPEDKEEEVIVSNDVSKENKRKLISVDGKDERSEHNEEAMLMTISNEKSPLICDDKTDITAKTQQDRKSSSWQDEVKAVDTEESNSDERLKNAIEEIENNMMSQRSCVVNTVHDTGINESFYEEVRSTSNLHTGRYDDQNKLEKYQDEINGEQITENDRLVDTCSGTIQIGTNNAVDEILSDVTSVTAAATTVLDGVLTDVDIAVTASKLVGEMMESLNISEEISEDGNFNNKSNVISNDINTENEKSLVVDGDITVPLKMKDRDSSHDGVVWSADVDTMQNSCNEQLQEINNNEKVSNELIPNIDKPSTKNEVFLQENTEAVEDQLNFNQAIRGYCRLINPDAMKGVVTSKVTELCLERALPCIGDVFTHILVNIGKLRVLDLSGNFMGPQSFRAIVLALTNNKTLKSLNLSNNKTDTQCSESLGIMLAKNSTLEELDVSSNQLGRDFFSRSVGPAMAINSTLKVLRCASCGFADLSMFIDSLSANPSISELDFSHNHIVDGTVFGEKLALLISKTTSLGLLNVKGTNISAEGMQEVRYSLEENRTLANLNIGGNQMVNCNAMLQFLITCIHHVSLQDLNLQDTNYKDVQQVFDEITTDGNEIKKSNLINLNLSNCGLVDSMIETLTGLIPGSLSGLQTLNLSNNSELTSDHIKGFVQLTSVDGNESNLQHLIYGLNKAENLPFTLSHFKCLSSLDMRKCQIATANLVQISFFLNKPDGIVSLCLDGQKLSGSDVLQVLFSDGHDNSLESLSLIGCALNDDDVEPIKLALKAGLGLKSLKLSANRITDRSIGGIVEALVLQENCVIEYINIANNKISCEGATEISRLLSSCSALHTLLLSSNSIGSDGLKAICGSVRPDSSLKLLDLKDQANPIDEEDMEEILTVLGHALGYKIEKNEYGQICISTNSLVTVNQDLTVLLTNLGGMTGDVGQAIDSSIVRTDYSKTCWPYLGLQEILMLSAVLKEQTLAEKVCLTKEEWNLIIGEGKDPCVPSWLQVDTHRERAVYLAGLPASVSANKVEGELDNQADCVITEVCIMKDPILQKPNGLCWILMSDTDSVEKAVRLYESGEARLFNQPYIISKLDVLVSDIETRGLEDKVQEEMDRRARQREAEDEEHRALLETSFAASKARHEYAAANPAYADGRIW